MWGLGTKDTLASYTYKIPKAKSLYLRVLGVDLRLLPTHLVPGPLDGVLNGGREGLESAVGDVLLWRILLAGVALSQVGNDHLRMGHSYHYDIFTSE